MLRSKKKITIREAQKSKPSPKEEQAKSKEEGTRGPQKNKKRPRRLEAQTKKHQEGKETHGKRLSSQDPQKPSRGADPSRRIVKED